MISKDPRLPLTREDGHGLKGVVQRVDNLLVRVKTRGFLFNFAFFLLLALGCGGHIVYPSPSNKTTPTSASHALGGADLQG